VYRSQFVPLEGMHPTRRDPAKVRQALAALEEQHGRVTELAARLARAGPYRDEAGGEARQAGEKFAAARAAPLGVGVEGPRAGSKWTRKDDPRLRQALEEDAAARDEWRQLVE